MQSRAVLIGLTSQPSAAACRVRAWSSAWTFLAASPRLRDRAALRRRDCGLHRLDERGQRGFGIGGHLDVDHLEALEVLVVRLGDEVGGVDADQLRVLLDARGVPADAVLAVVGPGIDHVPEVGELEAQDDIGARDGARRRGKIVRPREVGAAALVDDTRLQRLGELDQQLDAVRRARHAVGDDHRVLRLGEELRRFLHGAAVARGRRGGNVARDIELVAAVGLDRLLLQPGVERDHHRTVGRRHRDLVGAHHRLREVLQRHRRVVPLGEVAHQRVDVLRGVEGRHARRTRRRIEVVAADHDHRHTVAPGVVDRHRRVLQAHGAVAERHQRLAGNLEVAVAHRDGGFLVHAGEELRHLVAAVVDERLVDAAVARGAVRRAVLDAERLDDVDHEVRARHAADAVRRQLARRLRLGGGGLRARRQRGRRARVLRHFLLAAREGRRDRGRGARGDESGQEPAAVFACHGFLLLYAGCLVAFILNLLHMAELRSQ
jgi:hypothetical protein